MYYAWVIGLGMIKPGFTEGYGYTRLSLSDEDDRRRQGGEITLLPSKNSAQLNACLTLMVSALCLHIHLLTAPPSRLHHEQ